MFVMPKPYPREFRADVIAVARKGQAPIRQVAADFGISETCLQRWLRIADREDGIDRSSPPAASAAPDESAELREARKRIKLLEQEAEVMRRAVGYLSQNINPK
jgi:transposase